MIGVSYGLRAIGDVSGGGLSWLSPIGWYQAMHAYSGERWWPVVLLVVLGALTTAAAYLVFVVAVVTAATALTRSALGTVGIALSALLLMSIIGSVGLLHDWLPSTLAGAPAELLATGNPVTDYLPALAVAIVGGALIVVAAVRRLDRREV